MGGLFPLTTLFPLITMFSAGRNGTGKHNEIAGERVRTVDNDVGNVVLYQLSYARIGPGHCTLTRPICKMGTRWNYQSVDMFGFFVIPAEAGIQTSDAYLSYWIPAFAGMTVLGRTCRRAGSSAGRRLTFLGNFAKMW